MCETLTRDQVPANRKWDLSAIMEESEVKKYIEDIRAGFSEIKKFCGNVTKENALELLLTESKISYKLSKVFVFVHLKSDENKADAA